MNALTLPDIARQTTTADLPLDWVGMQGIALPVQIGGQRVAAEADAGVSLDDPQARGIHMSRLYLALAELEQGELDLSCLRAVLQRFLDSHAGLSRRAYLRLRLAPLLRRPALVSPLSGWKRYPLVLDTRLEGDDFQAEVHLELTYSSTCPCSAALARQLIQERFDQDFAGQPLDHASVLAWLGSSAGIVATPHSQRSSAHLRIGLAEDCIGLPLEELADLGESALGTAVQTAVKRADEQAFALANGQNLMFCEDAVRRLHRALQGYPQASRFSIPARCSMIRKNPSGDLPVIDESAYVDKTAIICGKVIIQANVFVGPYAVIRADEVDADGGMQPIVIGANSNIQDGVVIHSKSGAAVTIGEHSSIAHRSIVHGPCEVGDRVFIGFNSVLFNCRVGDGCVVRHNAVVDGCDLPAGFYVPSTERIGPRTDLASMPRVSVSASEFSEDVARTNVDLVRGYKSLQNEF